MLVRVDQGSGHFNHEGIKGVRGGSLPSGKSSAGGKDFDTALGSTKLMSYEDCRKFIKSNMSRYEVAILKHMNVNWLNGNTTESAFAMKYVAGMTKMSDAILTKYYKKTGEECLESIAKDANVEKNEFFNDVKDVMLKQKKITAKYLADHNINSVKLYRGVNVGANTKVYNNNTIESWTEEKSVAVEYAHLCSSRGRKANILTHEFKASTIYATPDTLYNDKRTYEYRIYQSKINEFIVMPDIKSINVR
jgi:hypothetical protein